MLSNWGRSLDYLLACKPMTLADTMTAASSCHFISRIRPFSFIKLNRISIALGTKKLINCTFLLGFSIISPSAPSAKQNNEHILFAPPNNLCAWQIVMAGTQHRKVNDASALRDFCRIFLSVSIGLAFRLLADIIIAGSSSTT